MLEPIEMTPVESFGVVMAEHSPVILEAAVRFQKRWPFPVPQKRHVACGFKSNLGSCPV